MSDDFDPRDALGMLDAEGARVRQSLDIRLPTQLAAWGIAWLVGFGAMWLEARGQRPYLGPGLSGLLFAVLLIAAGTVTGVLISRATTGIGGRAQRVGRRVGIAWGLGWLGFFGVAGALVRAGISPPATGILYAGGAMLVTGLIYLMSGAVFDEPVQTWLGVWLIVVAVGAAFTGPLGVLLVGALAGGGGFLVAAGIAWRRRRG